MQMISLQNGFSEILKDSAVATMSLSAFVTLTSWSSFETFFLGGFVRWKAAVNAEREQYRIILPSTVKVNPS